MACTDHLGHSRSYPFHISLPLYLLKGLLLFLVGSGLLAISGVHAVHLFPDWDGSELTWATLATLLLGQWVILFMESGWVAWWWCSVEGGGCFQNSLDRMSNLNFFSGATLTLLGLCGLAASCSTAPGAAFTYGFLLFFFVLLQIAAVCAFFFFRCSVPVPFMPPPNSPVLWFIYPPM